MSIVNPFLAPFLDAPGGATAALRGIELVSSEIDGVVEAVSNELRRLRPETFDRGAEIGRPAFGGADRATDLGTHHTRAHAVMLQTLTGLEADLDQFVTACRQASEILGDTDLAAADALNRNLRVLDVLDTGTRGDLADAAADRARNNPVGDSEGQA